MSKRTTALEKPYLRGHFHQEAFFFSLGACSMLIAASKGTLAVLSICVYTLSVCGLFGISALYHRPNWSPRKRLWMRRLDHAAIFLMIGGSATPICLLGMPYENGIKILTLLWPAAIAGILQSLFWVKAPKWLAASLYILAGWLVSPYIPELKNSLGLLNVTLLIVGGVTYTVGALVYAFKRPNPAPRIFGYHEIFHLLVIIGAFLHFLVVYGLIF